MRLSTSNPSPAAARARHQRPHRSQPRPNHAALRPAAGPRVGAECFGYRPKLEGRLPRESFSAPWVTDPRLAHVPKSSFGTPENYREFGRTVTRLGMGFR